MDNTFLNDIVYIDELSQKLIGALIGLSNAAMGNEDLLTENTYQLLWRGLSALKAHDREDIPALIKQVQSEKWRIVPDCAVCKSPCGRNADYDLKMLRLDDEGVRALKMKLLRNICQSDEKKYLTAKDMRMLFDALRAIGDVWDAENLKSVVEKTEHFMKKAEH